MMRLLAQVMTKVFWIMKMKRRGWAAQWHTL